MSMYANEMYVALIVVLSVVNAIMMVDLSIKYKLLGKLANIVENIFGNDCCGNYDYSDDCVEGCSDCEGCNDVNNNSRCDECCRNYEDLYDDECVEDYDDNDDESCECDDNGEEEEELENDNPEKEESDSK